MLEMVKVLHEYVPLPMISFANQKTENIGGMGQTPVDKSDLKNMDFFFLYCTLNFFFPLKIHPFPYNTFIFCSLQLDISRDSVFLHLLCFFPGGSHYHMVYIYIYATTQIQLKIFLYSLYRVYGTVLGFACNLKRHNKQIYRIALCRHGLFLTQRLKENISFMAFMSRKS